MPCSNCYNGCSEIVSDKCVKYTGIDVPLLGIQSGDSLSYIEASLIEFLTSTINGIGVKPIIDQTIICNVVEKYLPTCGEFTLNDYITALIKAACDIQVQIDAIDATLTTLNADYDVDCLTGVTASSDTHAVVQAVITKLCQVSVSLAALAIDVDTNYVKLADLNSLINAYLASLPSTTAVYTKMVPYVAVEYYGSLSNFDATGAGIGDWQYIYLCNGLNGTPDKRGRVPVGAIVGMGGGPLSSTVNPANPGNPNYSILSTAGANTVTLDITQIPSHTHAVTDPGHTHIIDFKASQADLNEPGISGILMNRDVVFNSTAGTTSATTGISLGSTGGSLAHSNIQPSLACYYIMHIP